MTLPRAKFEVIRRKALFQLTRHSRERERELDLSDFFAGSKKYDWQRESPSDDRVSLSHRPSVLEPHVPRGHSKYHSPGQGGGAYDTARVCLDTMIA